MDTDNKGNTQRRAPIRIDMVGEMHPVLFDGVITKRIRGRSVEIPVQENYVLSGIQYVYMGGLNRKLRKQDSQIALLGYDKEHNQVMLTPEGRKVLRWLYEVEPIGASENKRGGTFNYLVGKTIRDPSKIEFSRVKTKTIPLEDCEICYDPETGERTLHQSTTSLIPKEGLENVIGDEKIDEGADRAFSRAYEKPSQMYKPTE